MGGMALLDRSVKPPVLTSSGRQVLERCRLVLSSIKDLAATASSASIPVGELRIGVAQGLGDLVLGAPLDKLRGQYPGLMLSVVSNWSAALAQDVRVGALDCAVGVLAEGAAVPRGIQCTAVGNEQLMVIAARGFRLPPRPRSGYALRHLAECHWVLNPHGCGYREMLERASRHAEHTLRIAAEVYERELRLSLIARGVGLGLVTPRFLKLTPLRSKLRVIELSDFAPQITMTMFSSLALGALGGAVASLSAAVADTLR